MDEEAGDDVLADLHDIIELLQTKDVEELYESYELGHNNQVVEKDGSTLENDPGTNGCDTLRVISTRDFSTREELLNNVLEIVLKQGFVTKIKKSKKKCYVIIGCDRGGMYHSNKPHGEKRRKVTCSRLINCPFEVWGKRKRDGVWKLDLKNLSHNHEASEDMSGHPYCRRFTSEKVQRIQEKTMTDIPPRQILTSLRQSNPNLQAISRTLYNVRAKIKRES
ncbi:uncharacterized protein LOC141711063 [Apium graveolens]|uniref:uncharacterized protein LOC141711063 n=1 Tax=Apium graveolens TaxID=4045 RepID=UPI003D78EE64